MRKKKKKIEDKIWKVLNKIGIKEVYKWKLDEDYFFIHPTLKDLPNMKHDWFAIDNDVLIIKKNYAWNGCTPKYSLWDLFIVGTYDGPIDYRTGKQKCYYASLVHDALYQFKILDRETANQIFYELLKESDFTLAPIYFWAVNTFAHPFKVKTYEKD